MGAMAQPSERIVDRYAIYDQIAAGGMAVVHLGRLIGQVGFSRIVAIKKLHPQFAADPEFVAMFLDEAHLAVRVQHPNVVAPLDIVVEGDEMLVVMEYVSGETLAQLVRLPAPQPSSPAIIATVMVDALHGLHAAHEARAEDGTELNIVHRDVSPQNIMVGVDGISRVLDFGVAKAAMRSHATKDGEIKGKIAYMAPEQLKARPLDRRADIFAAGVVLWEALAGRRLFRGDDLGQTVERVLHAEIPPPSGGNPGVAPELDRVVLRALERDPERRFATARDFANALRGATALASPAEVADWVRAVGGAKLLQRIQRVAAIESHSSSRVRVAGRSPLHTPLGLMAMAEAPPSSVSSPDAPTVRPGADPDAPTEAPPDEDTVTWRFSKRTLVLGAGALLLGVAILVSMLWTTSGRPRPEVEMTPAAARVGESPTARPSTASTAAAREGESSPSAAATAAAVDTPSEPGNTAGAASSKALSHKQAPKTSKPGAVSPAASARKGAAAPAARCNPPYVVDAKGIRRIKPECL